MARSQRTKQAAPPRGGDMAYEAQTAVLLVKAGLGHLQGLTTVELEYHVPLLLLATGFERLVKVFLCLEAKASSGSWPDTRTMSFRFDHDLRRQLEEVDAAIARRIAGHPTRERRPFEALRDRGTRHLIELLERLLEPSERFSLGLGDENGRRPGWIEAVWVTISGQYAIWGRKHEFGPGTIYVAPQNRGVVILLERLGRALCRGILLVAEQIGERSEYQPGLKPFANLPTRQLGATRYWRSESDGLQARPAEAS
jgi:hypothetical protein